MWVHYFDPHYSYVRHPQFGFVDAPPELALDRLTYEELVAAQPLLADDATPDPFTVEMVKAIYDEKIAFTDAAIGSLLEGINNLDIDRSAVTVLTADHGEYFMERGRFGHGKDVYDELVHVPLIISGDIDETLKGRRFSRSVEVASVAHTLAELAQLDGNPFRGEDLLAVNDRERRPPAFSYGCYAFGTSMRKVMVELEGWKLIRHLDNDRYELYDMGRDPKERENQWNQETGTTADARKALLAALAT